MPSKNRNKPTHEKTCVVCNTTFQTPRDRQLTCGPICSLAHARKLSSEHQKQNYVPVPRVKLSEDELRRRRQERDRARSKPAHSARSARKAVARVNAEPRCKQTPNPRSYRARPRPTEDCGIELGDRPRVPVAPLLVAPPHVVDRSGLVTVAGVRIEAKQVRWESHWC